MGLALLAVAVGFWAAVHFSPHHGGSDIAIGAVGIILFLLFFALLTIAAGIEIAASWLIGLC